MPEATKALFSLNLFKTDLLVSGWRQLCRAHRQRHAAVYDAGFLQIGMGFSPFHAGLMMIPMVLGSMGMKRIVVQVVNRFGYRRVLVAATLGLALVSLLFMAVALMGWYYCCRWCCSARG
jgi:DHA2 family multidrug resistance protein-like MFS transporter